MHDAEHTLAFMDFVRDHSPSDKYTQAHEQYRGLVIFHHTQAGAALALENENPEDAIDAIHHGLENSMPFFALDAEEHFEEDLMVNQLRKMELALRESHGIETTLQEQLEEAVAARIMKERPVCAISYEIGRLLRNPPATSDRSPLDRPE